MKFMIQCIKVFNSTEVLTLEKVFVTAGNREFGIADLAQTMKGHLPSINRSCPSSGTRQNCL